MIPRFLVPFLLMQCLSPLVFGQDIMVTKAGKKDSVLLSQTWQQFVKAIEKRDTTGLKSLSLITIDCLLCFEPNAYPPKDYMVPVDTFIHQTFRNIYTTKLWSVIQIGNYTMGIRSFPGYKPSNYILQKGETFRIYEIYFTTYRPGEWAPEHKGLTHTFQFVKTGGGFRFYGFESLP